MSTPRNDIHALVAGVSLYLPGASPDQAYPPLPGCAVDARELASYLADDLGVPQDQIRLLTCSGDGPEPEEPEERRPTYANLVAALKALAANARPREQVLIYFAGHGTRVQTLIPEVKGTEPDECLVPCDAGTGARLLHDVEIAAIVAQMADRGLDVTLILDCCHSGGALKAPGGEVAVRGVASIDGASRPEASEIASREELAASWQKTAGRPPAGAVLLAACRPGELALEVFLAGRRRGLFTWALLDALRQLGTSIGYRLLHDRVLAQVYTLYEVQTPFLDGNGERMVLGGEPRRPMAAVTVLDVQTDSQSVLLAVGAPHGVGLGARFAIYPLGIGNLSRSEDRVALAEITEAGAVSSRARLIEILRPNVPIKQGAPALLLSVTGVHARRRVARLEGATSPLVDAVIEQLSRAEGSGFVETAPPRELPDFRLAAAGGGGVELLDAAGERLAGLAAPSGPEPVIAGLEHLARYRNLQGLSNPDPTSDLAGAIHVSLDRLIRPWQRGKPLAIDPEPWKTWPPSVRAGDWLCLTIENRSHLELNIVVLNLQADWSISQIYPRGAYLPLGDGRSEPIPLQVTWPFHQPQGREHFKIFAVLGPVDIRWLQLPALGELLPTGSPYKGLVPETHPQHAWTVVDVIYEVAR